MLHFILRKRCDDLNWVKIVSISDININTVETSVDISEGYLQLHFLRTGSDHKVLRLSK